MSLTWVVLSQCNFEVAEFEGIQLFIPQRITTMHALLMTKRKKSLSVSTCMYTNLFDSFGIFSLHLLLVCWLTIWKQVLPNLYSANMDPSEWKEPSAFRPERFLSADGKVVGKDRVLSFSLGQFNALIFST